MARIFGGCVHARQDARYALTIHKAGMIPYSPKIWDIQNHNCHFENIFDMAGSFCYLVYGKPNCYNKAMISQRQSKQSGKPNALPKKQRPLRRISQLAQLNKLAGRFALKESVQPTWTPEMAEWNRNRTTRDACHVLSKLYSLPTSIISASNQPEGSLLAIRTRNGKRVKYGIRWITHRIHIIVLNKSPRQLEKLINEGNLFPGYKKIGLKALIKLHSLPMSTRILERRGMVVFRTKTGSKRTTYSAYLTRWDTCLTLQSAKSVLKSKAVKTHR